MRIGQKVRVRPEFLECTELVLDAVYVVVEYTSYEWQPHQPAKIKLEGQPNAVYAAEWFEVLEEGAI